MSALQDFEGQESAALREIRLLSEGICIELVLSSLLATLVVSPGGSFRMRSCEPQSIADFYPGFRMPDQPCRSVDCTSEVTYPLTTWVMLFLLFGLVCIFAVRLPIAMKWCPELGPRSIRKSLYILPVYAVIYMVMPLNIDPVLSSGVLCLWFRNLCR